MALVHPTIAPSLLTESLVTPKLAETADVAAQTRGGMLELQQNILQNPGALANPFVAMLGVSLMGTFMVGGLKAIVAGEPPKLPLLSKKT
jgi:hypothetical protein